MDIPARPAVTDKSTLGQFRRNLTSRFRASRVDARNLREFGPEAPLFAELIWIPLKKAEKALKKWSSKDSANIVANWPEERIRTIRELPSIKRCLEHWSGGLSWEETGIYDQMLESIKSRGKVDRMRNLQDIKRRYHELDELFDRVKSKGTLSPREELVRGNYREEGGVLFHIGPAGEPFFGGKGHHRLAIALALGHEWMPAQLGCIHKEAIPSLPTFRCPPTSIQASSSP